MIFLWIRSKCMQNMHEWEIKSTKRDNTFKQSSHFVCAEIDSVIKYKIILCVSISDRLNISLLSWLDEVLHSFT